MPEQVKTECEQSIVRLSAYQSSPTGGPQDCGALLNLKTALEEELGYLEQQTPPDQEQTQAVKNLLEAVCDEYEFCLSQ